MAKLLSGGTERPDDGTMEEGPRGELALRIPAVPADTNASGDIFGGWIMGIMDMAAGSTAHEIAAGRVATVAVSDLVFLRPVHVGDLISCYAEVIKIGRTSITIDVDVWARRKMPIQHERVTKARFVMVAVDAQGKPRVVDSGRRQGALPLDPAGA